MTSITTTLQWDGDVLRVGTLPIGWIEESDAAGCCYGWFDERTLIKNVPEAEARAAVEKAAREALEG